MKHLKNQDEIIEMINSQLNDILFAICVGFIVSIGINLMALLILL